ncbi:hypothetical protein ASD11_10815 [Aeromicrobium sp. Root495]|nr:hypothetical protein ASD11_10815 [Aeromicrobium sp. Root495]
MAGTIVSGLALSGLVLASPSVASAEAAPAPTLKWKVSQQFKNNIGARVYSGGATEDTEGVITFPQGVGTHDSGNGVTSVRYAGTVDASFNFPGSTTRCYTITIANPSVEIDATGSGRIVADVSSDVPAVAQCGTSVATSTPVTRVTVTTFTAPASAWTDAAAGKSLTATPDFVGVLAPGSEQAVALTSSPDRPYNGESFAPSFLGAIAPGTRSHFYRTNASAAQPNKVPSAFTAEAPRPTLTATQDANDATRWTIAGQGFTRSTNPGDAGVYAGIAPRGGLPDVSSIGNISLFAGVAAFFGEAIDATTGAFDGVITLDPAKLDPTKEYSVYTWRAHSHSTTSQDTETPIDIDFEALKSPTTTSLAEVKTHSYGNAVSLTATVAGADAGSVVFTEGETTLGEAPISNGKATLKLPSTFAVGSHTVQASFAGSATRAASESTARTFTVKAAATTTSASVTKKPTTRATGTVRVVVRPAAGVATPRGTVAVVVAKGSKTYTVRGSLNANGAVNLTLPKVSVAGTWRVSARYGATTNHVGSFKSYFITFAR